jgi:shikimate kinase
MKILICGFMGAGKSTLLRKFRPNKLGFDCIDLDDAIALEQNIRPERLGEWIIQNGITLFRDLEKTKLKKLLRHESSMVISLGGGTLTPEMMKFIKADSECKLVFLDTSFDVCLARIKDDKNRPMSQISLEELKRLYESRKIDYKTADLILVESEIKEIEGLETLVHNLQDYA